MSNAKDTLEKMIDLNWSANWSELPPEAEQKVEEAYILLSDAHDIAEE